MILAALRRRPAVALLILLMVSAGCAGNQALSQADLEIERFETLTLAAQVRFVQSLATHIMARNATNATGRLGLTRNLPSRSKETSLTGSGPVWRYWTALHR